MEPSKPLKADDLTLAFERVHEPSLRSMSFEPLETSGQPVPERD